MNPINSRELITYIDSNIDNYILTETQRQSYTWLRDNIDLFSHTDAMRKLTAALKEMAYSWEKKVCVGEVAFEIASVFTPEYTTNVTPSLILRRKRINK